MNFIHRALGEGLAPDDFLQAMADIYKELLYRIGNRT